MNSETQKMKKKEKKGKPYVDIGRPFRLAWFLAVVFFATILILVQLLG